MSTKSSTCLPRSAKTIAAGVVNVRGDGPARMIERPSMRSPAEDQSPERRQLLADVAEAGIHVVHVDESENEPGWSYTVGMWHSFEQPEVIVIGLDTEVATAVLDAVADDAAEGGSFAAGTRHDDLLHGYPVTMRSVPAAQRDRRLGEAAWAYEGADFPCVQLVYPDKQGRWPWQPDVRDGFRRIQPVLDMLPPAAADGAAP